MKTRISAKARLASLLFSVVLVGATPVRSESPTPTPTPNPEAKHSLAEVAKEKELKGTEKGKGIVITNENLSEYAAKGGLTTATGTEGTGTNRRPIHQSGSASGAPVTVPPSGDTAREEERKRYWRSLYERQLNLVADIKHQIQVLDYEIPGLWRDFYSRDDPAYRDGVIKPKLDQALARSEQLEGLVSRSEGAGAGTLHALTRGWRHPRLGESTVRICGGGDSTIVFTPRYAEIANEILFH
jgi:hypothetical protein